MEELLCINCRHCIIQGDPQFALCSKTESSDYKNLKLVVGEETASKIEKRKYTGCQSNRIYGCGPEGKWFAPKEVLA